MVSVVISFSTHVARLFGTLALLGNACWPR